ncbi:MAG: dockerin type I domain-containing protein [Planctomycetia bacterium]|jgi:T5SS/PEP-CTERM-associated repeat protein
MTTVTTTEGRIGNAPGSQGTVTVCGPGSAWTTGSGILVGYHGNGTLQILNGGQVTTSTEAQSATVIIGAASEAIGTVLVKGPNANLDSYRMTVGDYGTGTLEITHGGHVNLTHLTIDNNLDGDSFINMATGGMLTLPFYTSEVILASFLARINGTDAIRYWDDTIDDWSLLTNGTLGVDYTLEFEPIEEYPYPNQEESGYAALIVGTAPILGDANGDGIVDSSDATILSNHWQQGINNCQPATWSTGDFNFDDIVDASDATILAGNWQQTTTPNTVPEPSTILLFLTASLGWLFVQRR